MICIGQQAGQNAGQRSVLASKLVKTLANDLYWPARLVKTLAKDLYWPARLVKTLAKRQSVVGQIKSCWPNKNLAGQIKISPYEGFCNFFNKSVHKLKYLY